MKNSLIIGGTSRLGLKIIELLIKKKIKIFFTYFKNIKDKNKINKICNNKKIHCKYFKLNLNKKKKIKELSLLVKLYKPEIIINNAAYLPLKKKFIKISDKELIKVFNINFFSYYYFLQNILRDNKKKILIINILSNVIKTGGKFITHYATSKSALSILSKGLAKEFKNVKFINISFPKLSNTKNKNYISYQSVIRKINFIINNEKKIKSGEEFFIKR